MLQRSLKADTIISETKSRISEILKAERTDVGPNYDLQINRARPTVVEAVRGFLVLDNPFDKRINAYFLNVDVSQLDADGKYLGKDASELATSTMKTILKKAEEEKVVDVNPEVYQLIKILLEKRKDYLK